MKSEERQKLAKERREEKAKYFGKSRRSKGTHLRRAPPCAGMEVGGVFANLC